MYKSKALMYINRSLKGKDSFFIHIALSIQYVAKCTRREKMWEDGRVPKAEEKEELWERIEGA